MPFRAMPFTSSGSLRLACQLCNAVGFHGPVPCGACCGEGFVEVRPDALGRGRACRSCDGHGRRASSETPCLPCGGSGWSDRIADRTERLRTG